MQNYTKPKEQNKNKNKLIPFAKFYFFIPKTYVLASSGMGAQRVSLNVRIFVMDNEASFQFSAIKTRLSRYAYFTDK